MLTFINILIGFFIFLILYQIILASNVVEGFDYQNYDENNPNNALILAQKNAGNIEYLKDRIDNVQGIFQQVQDLSGNVVALQSQVNGLVQAQKDYADQITSGSAPKITGVTDSDSISVPNTSNLATE